jgi:uncharacterized protein YxjI
VNKSELVKLAFNGDGPEEGFYLSDDFQWSDSLGNPPMDKASFQGMAQPLQSALPDLSIVIEDIREDGDEAVVTSHYVGTFRNDLDLSSVGMGVIAATRKAIVFPSQRDRVSFDGDKISEIHNLETGPDAGIAGFIKALGAEPN